jgi:hypothetical protein
MLDHFSVDAIFNMGSSSALAPELVRRRSLTSPKPDRRSQIRQRRKSLSKQKPPLPRKRRLFTILNFSAQSASSTNPISRPSAQTTRRQKTSG